MRALSTITILFAAGLAATALAQSPPPSTGTVAPELITFLKTPEEEKAAKAHAVRDWKVAVPTCNDPRLDGSNVIVSVPPRFDAAGKPISGVWRLVLKVEGCTQSRLVNLVYGVSPDGQITRTGTLMGSSAADPRLQRDALMYATLGMSKLAPAGCTDERVVDTAFEAFGAAVASIPAGREPRSWTEKWLVRACGVEGIVKLYFTPDATGTSISVKLNETVRAGP